MSKLVVSKLIGSAANNNVIAVNSGTTFKYTGMPLQTKFQRTDVQTTYAAAASGNGTQVTALDLTITPKFASSNMLITWMINGEMHYDANFLIWQDGALITQSGYEGYNNVSGNVRWSGWVTGIYDNDVSSTPNNWFIQYQIPAYTTASRVYSLAVRSSGGTAYTLYLNRTSGSPTTNYEVGVSTGMVMEIAT